MKAHLLNLNPSYLQKCISLTTELKNKSAHCAHNTWAVVVQLRKIELAKIYVSCGGVSTMYYHTLFSRKWDVMIFCGLSSDPQARQRQVLNGLAITKVISIIYESVKFKRD